jgi:hypothetical protein
MRLELLRCLIYSVLRTRFMRRQRHHPGQHLGALIELVNLADEEDAGAARGKSAVCSVRQRGHCGTSEKDIAESPEISWQLSLFRPLSHCLEIHPYLLATMTLQRYDGTIPYLAVTAVAQGGQESGSGCFFPFAVMLLSLGTDVHGF